MTILWLRRKTKVTGPEKEIILFVSGNSYHHGHLARAACCRVYQILEKYLPSQYRINHPILSTVTMEIEELHGKPTSQSLNWSQGDENPEVVDGFSGKVVDE